MSTDSSTFRITLNERVTDARGAVTFEAIRKVDPESVARELDFSADPEEFQAHAQELKATAAERMEARIKAVAAKGNLALHVNFDDRNDRKQALSALVDQVHQLVDDYGVNMIPPSSLDAIHVREYDAKDGGKYLFSRGFWSQLAYLYDDGQG